MIRFLSSAFTRPGATALAMIALYAGVAGMFHIGTGTDALNMLLPDWLVDCFNIVYTLAGLGLLCGMGLRKGNLEAAGWILLAVSVLVRGTVVVIVGGLSVPVLGLLVLYAAFFAAAVVRLVQIFRGQAIIVVHVVHRDEPGDFL